MLWGLDTQLWILELYRLNSFPKRSSYGFLQVQALFPLPAPATIKITSPIINHLSITHHNITTSPHIPDPPPIHTPPHSHVHRAAAMKSLLWILIAFASIANGFFSPQTATARSRLPPCSIHRFKFNTNKHSTGKDQESETINVAIFPKNDDDAFQIALINVLRDHPFCKMTGTSLSIEWIPTTTDESSWTKSELDIVKRADVACFSTVSSVKSYLSKLDKHLNIDPELPQEERRKLPNKPEVIADTIRGEVSAEVMAACLLSKTARECLNSGRWTAHNIYYPKDGQSVELKTESLENVEDEGDEEVEIDLDIWAASIMQAAGDVQEQRFWG